MDMATLVLSLLSLTVHYYETTTLEAAAQPCIQTVPT